MITIEAGFYGLDHPMKHPRICGFPLTGTVAASTETAGFDATLAANQMTYQFWRPTAIPATWEIAFSGSRAISYFGIAAHTLGSNGCTVNFQTWNGATWDTLGSQTPTDDGPILFLCARRNVTKARIQITGGTVPDIAVIQFGDATEFPQKAAYVGRRDYEQLIQTEYRTVQSDGGHVLGRYSDRKSQVISLSVENLSEAWKSAILDPLITHLKSYAVFVADRPSVFLKSVAFGQTKGDVVPERSAPNDLVSISVTIEFICHAA